MIEYFTAGIAVHFFKNFNMTLHSAAPPGLAAFNKLLQCKYNLLHCKKANPVGDPVYPDNAQGGFGFPQAQ
jgi:hypothetical protein